MGIRVNLSSCETFADLVVSLSKTLQSTHRYAHFPFNTVAEEVRDGRGGRGGGGRGREGLYTKAIVINMLETLNDFKNHMNMQY